MNMIESSKQIRLLAQQHANYQLSFEDYREQRKILLDNLDKQYNGVIAEQKEIMAEPIVETQEQLDKTQPYLASKIGKLTSFLKRTNEG